MAPCPFKHVGEYDIPNLYETHQTFRFLGAKGTTMQHFSHTDIHPKFHLTTFATTLHSRV